MNVLFWVEPLLEMNNPRFKLGWVDCFVRPEILALLEDEREHGIAVALNEPLAGLAPLPGEARVEVFTRDELEAVYGETDPGTVMEDWYRGNAPPERLAAMANLVRSRFAGFAPDVAITFSPAPFLAHAFPGVPVLHQEFAIVSRRPFTPTAFLDPRGMYRDWIPSRFAAEIEALGRPDERTREALLAFREEARRVLAETSPVGPFLEEARRRFDRLLLLPLQFSGYYAIDAHVPWRTQEDLLLHVLRRVPRDVGVIVTTHPTYNLLSDDLAAHLAERFPHFLHDPALEATMNVSQFLLPWVDGMATVSSPLAWQGTFWGKHVLALGPVHQALSSGQLQEVDRILGEPAPPREGFVTWMLTRYSVPYRWLHDATWLRAFLARAVERRDRPNPSFYDPVADPVEVLAHHREALRPFHAEPALLPSRDRLREDLAWSRELLEDRSTAARVLASAAARLAGELLDAAGQGDLETIRELRDAALGASRELAALAEDRPADALVHLAWALESDPACREDARELVREALGPISTSPDTVLVVPSVGTDGRPAPGGWDPAAWTALAEGLAVPVERADLPAHPDPSRPASVPPRSGGTLAEILPRALLVVTDHAGAALLAGLAGRPVVLVGGSPGDERFRDTPVRPVPAPAGLLALLPARHVLRACARAVPRIVPEEP